jgi:hypothetical protein
MEYLGMKAHYKGKNLVFGFGMDAFWPASETRMATVQAAFWYILSNSAVRFGVQLYAGAGSGTGARQNGLNRNDYVCLGSVYDNGAEFHGAPTHPEKTGNQSSESQLVEISGAPPSDPFQGTSTVPILSACARHYLCGLKSRTQCPTSGLDQSPIIPFHLETLIAEQEKRNWTIKKSCCPAVTSFHAVAFCKPAF